MAEQEVALLSDDSIVGVATSLKVKNDADDVNGRYYQGKKIIQTNFQENDNNHGQDARQDNHKDWEMVIETFFSKKHMPTEQTWKQKQESKNNSDGKQMLSLPQINRKESCDPRLPGNDDGSEVNPAIKTNQLLKRILKEQQKFTAAANEKKLQSVDTADQDLDDDDNQAKDKYIFKITISPDATVNDVKKRIVGMHENTDLKYVLTKDTFDLAQNGKLMDNDKQLEEIEALRKEEIKIINVVVPWTDNNNNNRFEIYQSSKIHLKEVSLKDAQFKINLEMRLFWNDKNLVNMYMYSYLYNKDDKQAMGIFMRKNFFVNDQGKVKRYWMPFFSFKEPKRIINCEEIGEVNDMKVKIHNFKNHISINKTGRDKNGDVVMPPIPHLELHFEGALIEPLELDDYPFDKQFLHLQFFFNKRSQSKYKIVHVSQACQWMDVERHGRYIPLTIKKSDSVADYRLVRDEMTPREQQEKWGQAVQSSRYYHKYELPHDHLKNNNNNNNNSYNNGATTVNNNISNHDSNNNGSSNNISNNNNNNNNGIKPDIREYRLIRIRLIRNSTADFVRYVLALLFLILSPISLLACDYHEDFSDIISNTIALLFTLVAAHYLLMDNLPNVLSFLDIIIICGYISIISWLVLVPFAELIDQVWCMYAAGMISLITFIFVMVLIIWKWSFNTLDSYSSSDGELHKCNCCKKCVVPCTLPNCCATCCPCMKMFRIASWETLAEEELKTMEKFYQDQKSVDDVITRGNTQIF